MLTNCTARHRGAVAAALRGGGGRRGNAGEIAPGRAYPPDTGLRRRQGRPRTFRLLQTRTNYWEGTAGHGRRPGTRVGGDPGGHASAGYVPMLTLTLTSALPLALLPKFGEAEVEPRRGGTSSHRMMATPSAVPGADGA